MFNLSSNIYVCQTIQTTLSILYKCTLNVMNTFKVSLINYVKIFVTSIYIERSRVKLLHVRQCMRH